MMRHEVLLLEGDGDVATAVLSPSGRLTVTADSPLLCRAEVSGYKLPPSDTSVTGGCAEERQRLEVVATMLFRSLHESIIRELDRRRAVRAANKARAARRKTRPVRLPVLTCGFGWSEVLSSIVDIVDALESLPDDHGGRELRTMKAWHVLTLTAKEVS